MNSENLSYRKALEELETIVRELENGVVDIDDLTKKIERASFLCQFLRNRLRMAEEEVQRILHSTEDLAPGL